MELLHLKRRIYETRLTAYEAQLTLHEAALSSHEAKPFQASCFFARIRAKKMVGVRGFEPPASASRTQRSSQTEPHPDKFVDSLI